MYLITRWNVDRTIDYFGPFPNEDRAKKYAESFEKETTKVYTVQPLIVPNCVTVKLNY